MQSIIFKCSNIYQILPNHSRGYPESSDGGGVAEYHQMVLLGKHGLRLRAREYVGESGAQFLLGRSVHCHAQNVV